LADRDRFPVVVHVVVYANDGRGRDEFALLKRARTGFMDGYFALPGGHQEQGESISQAAGRECREELGIEAADLTPVCVLPYRSGRHQGVNFVFACREYQGRAHIAEPELFDQLVWVCADRLPQPVAQWVPDALALVGRERWYQEMEWD
jgi:8-oxo-dGTP pyrophosphatase MutT (NUDIX family)